jgi:tRNA G18 (ribose-2'-O)-methylase SpoU
MSFEKKSMDELQRMNAEEFQQAEKFPIVLILDNFRSALNVGSLFRSADAFRIEAIYCCGITPLPPHREILKTALGSTESVNWKHFNTTLDAIQEIEQTHEVWALEQTHNSVPLHTFHSQKPIALVLGNEVNGVDEEVLKLVKGSLEIEQHGTKHSLNVAVSGGVALFHLTQPNIHSA